MDGLEKFIKEKEEKYKKQHPPDFMTHFNYVECLNTISNRLSVEYKRDIKNKIKKESQFLNKKLNLLKLIRGSFKEEYNTIEKNQAFAEVCVPWVAVKSYYLIFNLLLILEYLITCDEESFSSSHEGIIKKMKSHVKNNDLFFNKTEFNKIYNCKTILKWRANPHVNIKVINPDIKERIYQIIKILARYRKEEFKRKEKIKSLNCKKGKEFLDKASVNISEFFYWYRIKSNYRDLEFLDKDISSEQFKYFYKNYYGLTMNFYEALKKLINDLSNKRLDKEIL